MKYVLTLLKDLPEYPKGTKFKLDVSYKLGGDCYDEITDERFYMRLEYPNGDDTDHDEIKRLEAENDDYRYYDRLLIPIEIIDDPAWIRKEMDLPRYRDLSCPKCHGTRFLAHVRTYRSGNASDGYFHDTDVSFECECGHVYNIYNGAK